MRSSTVTMQCGLVALVFVTFIFTSSCLDPRDGSTSEIHPPRPLDEGNTCYSLKDGFQKMLGRYQELHSRQKRLAYFRWKFPALTAFEIKWAIAVLVPSELMQFAKLQSSISVVKLMPPYLADDPYLPPFNTLFGQRREGDDIEAKDDYIINNTDRRKKRDIQIEERLELYGNFQNMLDSYGMAGQECLLRTVCEVADAPLRFGVIGDFLNLLFTPSAAAYGTPAVDMQELEPFLVAERIGRLPDGEDCGTVFAGCPTSVFDSLPLLNSTVISF